MKANKKQPLEKPKCYYPAYCPYEYKNICRYLEVNCSYRETLNKKTSNNNKNKKEKKKYEI